MLIVPGVLIVPGIVPGVLIVPGIVPGVFVNNKGAVGFAVCTVPAVVVVAVASALAVSSNHDVNVAVGCVVAIISEVAVAIRAGGIALDSGGRYRPRKIRSGQVGIDEICRRQCSPTQIYCSEV